MGLGIGDGDSVSTVRRGIRARVDRLISRQTVLNVSFGS